MPGANISEVKVVIHDEIRGREEYNPPMKKAEVTIIALVADNEDGAVALEYISGLAAAKVKAILLGTTAAAVVAAPVADKPAGKRQAKAADEPKVEPKTEEKQPEGESSPTTSDASPDLELKEEDKDEWSTTTEVKPVTDADLLAATSAAAGRLGSKDPVKELIGKYSTKPDGEPFKVQEIPAAMRPDYLTKLAAL